MRWKYGKLLANLGNSIEALCGPQARHGDDARELRDRTRAEALAIFAAAGIGYASDTRRRAASPRPRSCQRLASGFQPENVVELSGLEPLTPCLQSRCSSN
jgi:2-dehydropantoate 2-reductase